MAAARSVSVVKLMISSPAGSSVTRRGYAYAAGASQGVGLVSSGRRADMLSKDRAESDKSWGPDPLTGYYRPVNRAAEIDAAELRNMLLKNRTRPN
uniref:Late embryogenesis abundant protein Lea5 n=1 Tax=Kalanchoe fedtschenkoi TaxID=63787 RepID=A0A7N0UQS9_KALFE